MGKPYDERRRTLKLAAHRLRMEGKTNKEIAEQIGVKVEQVPGMALAGRRIAQLIPSMPAAASSAEKLPSDGELDAESPAPGKRRPG